MTCPNCGYCEHCGRGGGYIGRPWRWQNPYWYGEFVADKAFNKNFDNTVGFDDTTYQINQDCNHGGLK